MEVGRDPAQLIRGAGKTWLWSRGDEMVSGAFPEIIMAAASVPEGTVLDGEIVAWDDTLDRPFPFTRLQRRLNRQAVELSFWPQTPVTFIAFDVLETGSRDIRGQPLAERRRVLESSLGTVASTPLIRRSSAVAGESWEQAARLIDDSRRRGVEGMMLKRRDSPYQAGRPTGLWWKLKVQPYTMDAVLIAAQPGHGRRAGLLTDYTFGVWHEGAWSPLPRRIPA